MLDDISSWEREDKHGDGGGEVVAYVGIGLEYIDIHAEEAADEGEGEEDECYPAGHESAYVGTFTGVCT